MYFKQYFKPVYYISKMLGLFLFSHGPIENALDKAANFAWSMPILLLYNLFAIEALTDLGELEHFKKLHRVEIGDAVILLMCFIKFWADYVWNSAKRGRIKRLLDKIDTIDNGVITGRQCRILKIHAGLLLSGMLLFSTINKILIEKGAITKFYRTGYVLELHVMAFENFCIHEILKVIREMYVKINEKLLSIPIRSESWKFEIAEKNITPLQQINLDKIMATIFPITELHREISKITLELNKILALPVLGSVALLFALLTTYSHYIVFLFQKRDLTLEAFPIISISLCWEITFILQLLLIVYSWDSTAKEANKSGSLIHDVWNTHGSSNKNYKHCNQLQVISLQLLHSKLNFTAFGLFSLNWTLILMVGAAVTSYLVILIQFDIS